MRIRVTSEDQLPSLLDYVHDRPYDLDSIHFDEASQELRLSIELRSRKTKPGLKGLLGSRETTNGSLIFRGVNSYEISDDAKIGQGDIATITCEPPKLILRGALPVNLTMSAERLDAELVADEDADFA